MDVSSIKQADLSGTASLLSKEGEAANGSKGLSLSFVDLLKTAGVRIEEGFNVMTDREGVTTLPDDAERALPAEKSDRRLDDDSGQPDSSADEFTYREDDRAPPEGSAKDDHGTATAGDRKGGPDGERDGYASHGEDAARDGGDGGHDAREAAADGKSTAENPPRKPADDTAANAPADMDAEPAGDADADAGPVPAGTPAQNANQVLAGLLAAAQSANASGEGEPGRGNAVDGLTTASAAVAKSPSANGGNAGGSNADTNTQGQGQSQNHGKSQGQGQSQSHAQVQVQSHAQVQAGTSASNTDVAAQQAAALSRLVGDGNPVAVRVAVADGASVMASQPGSTLVPAAAAAAATAAEGADASQRGQQPLRGPVAAAPKPVAEPAVNPAANVTGQSQAQAMAAQATATAAAGSNTAAPLAAVAGQTAPQIQVLGADGSPASALPGDTGNTAPTHNTTPAHTANAHRPPPQSRSVADQVSVQITRAIKAGVDKINIQLKPASLGRVDVRLEVGHDGRVQAVVIADNKDTLDLLQRDARELQRALQEAGLQSNAGDLSFSLREQGGQESARREPGSADASAVDAQPLDAEASEETLSSGLAAEWNDGMRPDGRIDIRA